MSADELCPIDYQKNTMPKVITISDSVSSLESSKLLQNIQIKSEISNKDSYIKAVKHQFTLKSFKVEEETYKLTIKIYSDDELYIYMKEIVTNIKYDVRKSAKEIMLLTQSSEFVLNT